MNEYMMQLDQLICAAMEDTGLTKQEITNWISTDGVASNGDCQICGEWSNLISEKLREIDAVTSNFEVEVAREVREDNASDGNEDGIGKIRITKSSICTLIFFRLMHPHPCYS